MDISQTGHFINRTFNRQDITQIGYFIENISQMGHFIDRNFYRQRIFFIDQIQSINQSNHIFSCSTNYNREALVQQIYVKLGELRQLIEVFSQKPHVILKIYIFLLFNYYILSIISRSYRIVSRIYSVISIVLYLEAIV